MRDEAFRLAQDPDHKYSTYFFKFKFSTRFELAIQLNRIQDAFNIAKAENSSLKWKQVLYEYWKYPYFIGRRLSFNKWED